MEEEELKIETHSILCPHCKKVFRIDDVAKMYIEEGQLAEREKCLKMIEELKKRFEKRYYGWGDLPIWRKEFKELTQKINEVEKK
jgi:glutaredoxin